MQVIKMNGFIGFGNLAGSVVAGFLSKNVISPDEIAIFDKKFFALRALGRKYGIC